MLATLPSTITCLLSLHKTHPSLSHAIIFLWLPSWPYIGNLLLCGGPEAPDWTLAQQGVEFSCVFAGVQHAVAR